MATDQGATLPEANGGHELAPPPHPHLNVRSDVYRAYLIKRIRRLPFIGKREEVGVYRVQLGEVLAVLRRDLVIGEALEFRLTRAAHRRRSRASSTRVCRAARTGARLRRRADRGNAARPRRRRAPLPHRRGGRACA